MKISKFAFVCLFALAAQPVMAEEPAAPSLPPNVIAFHAPQAYFSGVRLEAGSELKCKEFGWGETVLTQTIQPQPADSNAYTGVSATGDALSFNVRTLEGRTMMDFEVNGVLNLASTSAAQLAALGKPIGLAFDLNPTTDPILGTRTVFGGRVYLITKQDKDGGACHGMIVELVPASASTFVEADSKQPKTVEQQPAQPQQQAQQPAQQPAK
jgi:hypothetical protein